MKKIQFTEVNPLNSKSQISVIKNVNKIIRKKNFILGKEVNLFEKKFAKMSKCNFAVGCGSGTDALLLALMALNLNNNDEIIVPGLTYISSGLSVILNGSKLILCDIDSETGLLDIKKLKEKITKKTKAIIPVNMYGQRVDLKKLRSAIGKKVHIIEDSAQSHFAFLGNNKHIKPNYYADASCYSFYPAKNLGAFGDGGIITVNKKSLYKKLLALRNLGSVKKHKHSLIGMNSRLDTIQAVVLNKKLDSILFLNEKRRKIARFYDKHLKTISGIKLTKTDDGSSRHLYVIRVKKRARLMNFLLSKNINVQLHYPYSLNKLNAFKHKIKKTKLKNSEEWAKECLSLPMHPNLTENEALVVINEIKKFFKQL